MIAKGPSDVVSTHPGAAHTALALAERKSLEKWRKNLRRIIGKALFVWESHRENHGEIHGKRRKNYGMWKGLLGKIMLKTWLIGNQRSIDLVTGGCRWKARFVFLGSFWYFEPIINELRLGGFKKPRNMSKCRTVYSNLGQHPDFVHEIRDRPRKLGLSLPFLNLCQPFNSLGIAQSCPGQLLYSHDLQHPYGQLHSTSLRSYARAVSKRIRVASP